VSFFREIAALRDVDMQRRGGGGETGRLGQNRRRREEDIASRGVEDEDSKGRRLHSTLGIRERRRHLSEMAKKGIVKLNMVQNAMDLFTTSHRSGPIIYEIPECPVALRR
jgi:hypothetical protein